MTGEIFTIGYASVTQDALIDALCEARVKVLADVRALPLSRRAGFSKTSLKAAVEEAGLTYLHFRDLGTPKDGRDAARRGDYATLEQIYAGQLELPEALAQMAQLQAIAREKRTCLICYCEDAAKCHRALLVSDAFNGWKRNDLHPAELAG